VTTWYNSNANIIKKGFGLKVDILSDLHIDGYFILSEINTITNDDIIDFYSHFLPEKTGEVLIVAGDISHGNELSAHILKMIKECFAYKMILCVLGNHDYYIVQDNGKYSISEDRASKMRALLSKEEDIYLLDGYVVEYKGVRFGGADGWYDGSYLKKNFGEVTTIRGKMRKTDNKKTLQMLWEDSISDAKYIKGMDWQKKAREEYKKLTNIAPIVDVMISHINPSIHKRHTLERYRGSKVTSFLLLTERISSKTIRTSNTGYLVILTQITLTLSMRLSAYVMPLDIRGKM